MAAGLAVAHLAVVGIWVLLAAVAAGTGFLVLRLNTGTAGVRGSVFAAIWTGMAAIVLFLQLWHFAFPVDARSLTGIVFAGVLGLALRLSSRARGTSPCSTSEPGGATLRAWLRPGATELFAAGAFLTMVLWLAHRSLAPFTAYDSEMYLVPGVEWAKAFPLVPGLGALHGRFGFNNSNVLLTGVLESGPWPPASPHLLNGFFLFVIAARSASALHRLHRAASSERSSAVFDLVLLAPLVAMAVDDQLVPGLSADVAVAAALFGRRQSVDRSGCDIA